MKNKVRLTFSILFVFFFLGIFTGCSKPQQTLILISIDGFRWDYPEKAATPTLDLLIRNGVRAKRLIPCFPTKTFPNHYTIVTGLYPEHHGIVANSMYDPKRKKYFSLGSRDAIRDSSWWGGEPIWVTAEKQGLRTASFFWPGTECKIKGYQPTYWKVYDGSIPNDERVRQILAWLDLPKKQRPRFLTLYFSTIDDLGHEFGPESPQVRRGIQQIDSTLALLMLGLQQRNLTGRTNIIIVSDHGMCPIDPDSTIYLDDFIDLSSVDMIDWNPVAAMNVKKDPEKVYEKLSRANRHLHVYRREEMPPRLHYRDNPRIPQIIAFADPGWSITSHETVKPEYIGGGNHGFDNACELMGGIFIASGPAFRKGLQVEPLENIHLYELMAAILNLKPAPNDGDFEKVRHLLR